MGQKIPDDVKVSKWQFFLKTSVPRIMEEKRKEYEEEIEVEKEAAQKEKEA